MGSAILHWRNYTVILISHLRGLGYSNAKIGNLLGISSQGVGLIITRQK